MCPYQKMYDAAFFFSNQECPKVKKGKKEKGESKALGLSRGQQLATATDT